MLSPSTVLANRWEIREELAAGGQALLYRASDRVDGRTVVVKVPRRVDEEEAARTERELRALDLLRVPGVVRLVGTGRWRERRYLVMEEVTGTPFPGRPGPVPWRELVPILTGLLSVLARVHAFGIVHRDLSPSNVLVRPDGSVVVLDFGLARGRPLGEPMTLPSDVLGTVPYVPPEVLLERHEPGIAADLFAVGAMAWESTTGAPPWPTDLVARLAAFQERRAPTWAGVGDPDARRWASALLAFDPRQRPASAAAALAALDGPPPAQLPYCGPRAALDAALERLEAGTPVRIGGPRGSGRTRLLQEIERAIRDRRGARWLPAADRPFGSLVAAGLPMPPEDAELDECHAWFEERIAARGEVLLADEPHRMDAMSLAFLRRFQGPVARVVEGEPADVTLGALSADDLLPLFTGTERLLHLRTGPAEELRRRTGGSPLAVALELAAWERAGFARRDATGIDVSLHGLDELRTGIRVPRVAGVVERSISPLATEILAWTALAEPYARRPLLAALMGRAAWEIQAACDELHAAGLLAQEPDGTLRDRTCGSTLAAWSTAARAEAHRKLALQLPPDAPERVFHTLVGDLPDACDRVAETARHAAEAGNVRLAARLLGTCARWPHLADRPGRAVHRAWLLAALATEDAAILHDAREGLADADPDLQALVAAAVDGRAGSGGAALDRLEALGALEDPELESWRLALRAQAAARSRVGRFSAISEEIARWAAGVEDPRVRAQGMLVLAWARYFEERYAEAEALHEQALALRMRGDLRVSSLSALASVRLERGRWDAAREAAQEARRLARRLSLRAYEARLEWLLRRADYQSGVATEPDLELVAAAAGLGDPTNEGLLVLNEAAVAWRAGASFAEKLALRARERLGEQSAGLVAAALAIAAGARLAAEPAWRSDLPPLLRLQIRALGGRAGDDDPRSLAANVPEEDWDRRMEVLTVRECLERLIRP